MSRAVPAPVELHPRIADWLSFADDGVVRVRTGRVELGQGNGTALLQIVADELDVTMDQLELLAGDTRESPNEGFTSGSLSIQMGGVSLRLAASAARTVLLREAAALLQTRPDALSVAAGRIFIGERDSALTYWRLEGAATLAEPVMDHAAPKAPSARRIAGTSQPRVDLASKILGGGFIHDVVLEGMLHGRVVHPPSFTHRLVDTDWARLEALPGVVAVVRDGSFLGILAEREEQAVRAADVAERRATWSAGAQTPSDLHGALESVEALTATVYERGEVAAAAGTRHATRVTRPFIAHGSISPSCALAEWRDGRLTVWSHAQGPHPLRAALAVALDMDPSEIDVIHRPGAGCYGHNGADDAALDAALLARGAGGRPVRVLWSRGDELAVAPLGPAQVTAAEATVDAEGAIAGLSLTISSTPFGMRPGRNGTPNLLAAEYTGAPVPSGAGGDIALLPNGGAGGADRNSVPYYDIPAVRVVKRTVTALPYRSSSIRALGGHMNVFAIETLMDDIAAASGTDPLALRLRQLTDPRARHVLERTAERAGWPGAAAEGSGLGLGFARYKNTAAYCAVAVRVVVDEAVRVTDAWSVLDAGECINPDGAANQLEGSIIQAVSWTLKEAVAFDGPVVVSRDWESYPILGFAEVPRIETEIVARPEEPPLGLAEAAMGPTAAAIGNAVFAALGVRVRDLPLTREAIMAALELGADA